MLLASDEGTATAELAVALPALALVMIFCFVQLSQFALRAEIQADLAQYARALARLEPERNVSSWFHKRHPSLRIKKSQSGGALCVSTQVASAVTSNHLQHCVWLGDY
jgi:hypothetical protein